MMVAKRAAGELYGTKQKFLYSGAERMVLGTEEARALGISKKD
jgi:hypothetical protein